MKRGLAASIGLAGVTALLLTAILVPGPPARQPTQDVDRAGKMGAAGRSGTGTPSGRGGPRILGEEEALREDARWYAEDMGVSLDEAIRFLRI
jgi:hypothetical protein